MVDQKKLFQGAAALNALGLLLAIIAIADVMPWGQASYKGSNDKDVTRDGAIIIG